MIATTDEINLQRLLVTCENKVKTQQLDLWSGSEKQKYASYIKYLEFLSSRVQKTTSVEYETRIQALRQIVLLHKMQGEVEKGTTESRITKKKFMDHLRQLHTPEPDWLLNLKQQKELGEQENGEEEQRGQKEIALDSEEGWDQSEEDLFSSKVTKSSDAKKQADKDGDSETVLRKRNTANTMTREEETSNIEHALQHHRQLHDEMTTDLGKMAHQLKLNSQTFGDILKDDDTILRDAQKLVENNLEKMRTERQRLDAHYSKSWGTSFMNLGVVLFVCIMFIFVFFTIKFLPKA